MKRTLSLVFVLTLGTAALAQEAEVTKITSETKTVSEGVDLLSGLWLMEDAVPVNTRQVDLRFGFRWVTESSPAHLGDGDDDFVVTPSIAWGAYDNLELSLAVPAWVGDGGDMPAQADGNYDTTIGALWRIYEQGGPCADGCLVLPSVALSGKARIPTGCGSSGIDGELRLIFTNEYDSGIRSHLNVFGAAINGKNADTWTGGDDEEDEGMLFGFLGDDGDEDEGEMPPDPRHVQWGVVFGLDGPLCADGAVRWVADYVHRSSEHYGRANMNLLELGWEWTITDADKLGMGTLIGLDNKGDTPNFGAGITYSHSLTY